MKLTQNIMSGGHYYDAATGEPRHFIAKKDGSGLRPTTVADARKNGWLPSATTILKCLDKPALTMWHKRNAAIAALTTPRNEGEDLDTFLERILSRDSESISDAAKQLGTEVHDAIEKSLTGEAYSDALRPFVGPVLSAMTQFGKPVLVEKTVVGDGYAGRVDLVADDGEYLTVIDFKTTGSAKLPKKSYTEHAMQLACYGAALENLEHKGIRTCNIYISTARPGEISVAINEDWGNDYEGFRLTMALWRWLNKFPANGELTHSGK
jgi:hypothetical protein